MGQAKDKFDFQDVELANFTRALALPARIGIIRMLMEQDDWLVSSRFNELPLNTQVLQKHLNALKTAGLIDRMSRNSLSFYKLNTEKFNYLSGSLNALFQQLIPQQEKEVLPEAS